ncbi:4Fe-4S ferredoxin iron-sulfur binding domain protein [Ammonifex degensii KC4]|uniref:4Fe-4S ferredoxin iron-sulfur binding domain protein n=1 Tax=Ammonifex degensii (strain DSM 10501 / KC4) TaxID=429009 RepID=C9RB21_AMMDK|nr:4Fe-4S dicluster domain-containing protein [Ammonifex degensii]ACX51448.1 4Fe-4S ferredoxin iron-sulfur binding domain protein [Ammonifex degensii KC4]
MPKAVLVDLTKCIGCRSCMVACKQWNDLPAERQGFVNDWATPRDTTAETWTVVKYYIKDKDGRVVWRFIKRQCMHCVDPACVKACFSGALRKTPEGPVIQDPSRCIACLYCFNACPFHVPRYRTGGKGPVIMQKCRFCFDPGGTYDRVGQGQAPACVRACPGGALKFGERDALLKEAKDRIAQNPGRYVNQVYGESEFGGTSWLYLSDVPFEELGFPGAARPAMVSLLTWTPLAAGLWLAAREA